MMETFTAKLSKPHKLLLAVFTTFLFILIMLPTEEANASRSTEQLLEVGKPYKIPLSVPEENSQEQQNEDKYKKQRFTVKSGDNLAKIFKRAGFSAQTLHAVTQIKDSALLKKIHPGDTLSFYSDGDSLIKIVYPLSKTRTLTIQKQTEKSFASTIVEKDIELRLEFASAKITSNFWNAGVNAGLSDKQIMNLANIFGWDIDFVNDIRKGDTFAVIFEQHFIDGQYVGDGNILAAEFINQEETFQAVKHKDGEFYTPSGRSMRKAFLRAPVNFKYVSSNFNPRRFHPIQKRIKPHNGVDYAAKIGTPVVAAGNGKVIASAYNKYNGHYVFIQHGNDIVTKYLHFSKRAVRKGQRVKQGQLIGYVGNTGMSGGPHLHYEFVVNGVHRNPRTVKLPKAAPLPKKEKEAFTKIADQLLATLVSNKRVLLAYQTTGE